MKSFRFASFAALSLSSAEAHKLSKSFEDAQTRLTELEAQGFNRNMNGVMESVQSLQRAVKFHQKEERLLTEIGADLKSFWHEADQSQQFVVVSDQDKNEGKTQSGAKGAAKTDAKTATKAQTAKAAEGAPKSNSMV